MKALLCAACKDQAGAGALSDAVGKAAVPTMQLVVSLLRGRVGAGLLDACSSLGELRYLISQILGKVYAVLSDQEQRALYDQQGIVDEESTVLTEERNWEEYWRLLFKKVGSEQLGCSNFVESLCLHN